MCTKEEKNTLKICNSEVYLNIISLETEIICSSSILRPSEILVHALRKICFGWSPCNTIGTDSTEIHMWIGNNFLNFILTRKSHRLMKSVAYTQTIYRSGLGNNCLTSSRRITAAIHKYEDTKN